MSHRIVIVGGGAGGLELATRLGRTLGKRAGAAITLVDCHLTHVWKPLLHEVAAGSLNTPANELNYVAQAKWNHFQFRYGRLSGIDRENKTVRLSSAPGDGAPGIDSSLGYDTLVIAVGSVANDFNTPGAAEHCIFLDTPEQATRFHRLLLGHYLAAQANPKGDARLGIAIVGAGATGVELAAELVNAARELAAYGLCAIAPENVRITVLDGAARVLPGLSERISGEARETLERLGIDVITSARVTEVTAEGIRTADGTLVESTLKVWAAGIKAPPFLRQLDGLETNRINQLVVRPSLQTSMDDNIFAFGDCAACLLGDGSERTVPPRAQAAHQQAALLARSIPLKMKGGPLPAYRYRDYGSLVSLSRFSTIGNLMGSLMGSVGVEGYLARFFYVSLYRMHQIALSGVFRTALLIVSDRISRRTSPRLKLH
jgi:NADH dehydrogenase